MSLEGRVNKPYARVAGWPAYGLTSLLRCYTSSRRAGWDSASCQIGNGRF